MAREVGVSDELRGWNWFKSPLKPYYSDVKIPMYLACSKYCPTNRDVFLVMVEGEKGHINERVALGSAVHRAVGKVINSFLDGKEVAFESWYEETLRELRVKQRFEVVKERCRVVWNYTYVNCRSRLLSRMSEQPYSSLRDSLATSIPFLVEHRVTGGLLGLSGFLSIDCYDYLRGIVYDLKVADVREEWFRLYPTGYAIVLESIYEIPVDIGCTVYVRFQGGKLVVLKDLFFINDDLRSWWIEERDKKLEIVAQRKDPGLPKECTLDCIYKGVCRC